MQLKLNAPYGKKEKKLNFVGCQIINEGQYVPIKMLSKGKNSVQLFSPISTMLGKGFFFFWWEVSAKKSI